MANAKTPATATGTTRELRPVEKFIDYLNRKAAEDDTPERAFEIAADQLDRILSSETLDEMWDSDDFDSQGGRDLPDVEQQVNSFTVHKSDKYTSGIPAGDGKYFYIIVKSQRLSDGEEFIWNTGAALLIGKMRWLEAAGHLGTPEAQCVIREFETNNGKVLKLKAVPRRAVNAA